MRERDKGRGFTHSKNPDDLKLITDKQHPRYDPRIELELDEGLVESINVHGVIEPIVAFKDGPDVEVLDGRQRVRAAREVNRRRLEQGAPLIEVSYVLRKITDNGAAVSIRNHANIRAEQSIPEKARSVQHDMEVLGKSLDQAASERGVDVKTIKSWLRLLDCTSDVQRAVVDGRITFTQAIGEIAKLPRDQQGEKLGELAGKRGAPAGGRQNAITGKLKTGRPSAAVIRAAARHPFEPDTLSRHIALLAARIAIRWAAGEVTTDELLVVIPALRPAIVPEPTPAEAAE